MCHSIFVLTPFALPVEERRQKPGDHQADDCRFYCLCLVPVHLLGHPGCCRGRHLQHQLSHRDGTLLELHQRHPAGHPGSRDWPSSGHSPRHPDGLGADCHDDSGQDDLPDPGSCPTKGAGLVLPLPGHSSFPHYDLRFRCRIGRWANHRRSADGSHASCEELAESEQLLHQLLHPLRPDHNSTAVLEHRSAALCPDLRQALGQDPEEDVQQIHQLGR